MPQDVSMLESAQQNANEEDDVRVICPLPKAAVVTPLFTVEMNLPRKWPTYTVAVKTPNVVTRL